MEVFEVQGLNKRKVLVFNFIQQYNKDIISRILKKYRV